MAKQKEEEHVGRILGTLWSINGGERKSHIVVQVTLHCIENHQLTASCYVRQGIMGMEIIYASWKMSLSTWVRIFLCLNSIVAAPIFFVFCRNFFILWEHSPVAYLGLFGEDSLTRSVVQEYVNTRHANQPYIKWVVKDWIHGLPEVFFLMLLHFPFLKSLREFDIFKL